MNEEYKNQLRTQMQQYTQQLSGHVAELQIFMNTLHHTADLSGKTPSQYIQKFIMNYFSNCTGKK